MSADTKIEYLTKTWNPIAMRCTKVSEGCRNCWHLAMAKRHAANPTIRPDVRAARAGGKPFLNVDELRAPLYWKKKQRIGVQYMGDLFHEDISDEDLFAVWDIFDQTTHDYLVLTKRPQRMHDFLRALNEQMPNVWLGVSCENQQAADERIPLLLQTPAAVRFVSVEPMLGPVDLGKSCGCGYYCDPAEDGYGHHDHPFWTPGRRAPIDWVVCGGESGPGARPMHPDWVRSSRDQCAEAGVPFLFKQWGEWFPRDQWKHNPDLILPDDDAAYRETSRTHLFEDMNRSLPVHRVGKKAAGRVLDGRTWNEMPAVTR